jgi:aspartate ammonia-lyase
MSISGVLKAIASIASKFCADMRLMSSGPRAGLAEVELPSVQPGSSIMPGKVNPVIPEMVMQVYFRVLGNDLVVARACEGELDLNVWESVIIESISESTTLLSRSIQLLTDRCVTGIRANRERCARNASESLAMSTVIASLYDYGTASDIAKEAAAMDKTIEQVVVARNMMSKQEAATYFDPALLTRPSEFQEIFAKKMHGQTNFSE